MSIANCITFWIAVVGFALSIYNFVKSLIANHKRLCISVKQIYNEAKFTVMLVEFTNKSQLGISVTRGEINGVPFGEQPTTLYTYTHPELNKRPVINTEILPLYIAPLGSSRVLLRTEHVLPVSGDPCKVVLGTSRGRVVSRALALPESCGCFVSLLEYLE